MTRGGDAASADAIRDRLAEQRNADFGGDDTVQLEGWIIAPKPGSVRWRRCWGLDRAGGFGCPTAMMQDTDTAPRWLKPATDYGPLAAFLLVYALAGLMAATAALLAATLISLALSLWYLRRLPVMPLLTAAIALVFGGLTLWLQDETFIKMKPTIINAIFALLLLGGLMLRQIWLKPLLGTALSLTDEGWRRLTLRFGLFFAAMAGLNEIVWRSMSTDVWVAFKVFGLLGLTVAFMLAQTPLLKKHRVADAE